MRRSFAIFSLLTSSMFPMMASSAQYLCQFQTRCLTDNPNQCDDVNEHLFVLTEQDTLTFLPGVSPQIQEMFGNVDIIGNEDIVTGNPLPPTIRLQLPPSIWQSDKLLEVIERVSEIETDDDVTLQAGGPTIYLSPSQRLTTPSVLLRIDNDFTARYDVDVTIGLDLTFHGTCEEPS